MYTIADAPAAADAASAASAAAAAAPPADDGGAFGFLANSFEAFLEVLDDLLERANVPYSYGYAIILLTVLVKLATFPLSQKSMQSTMAMQALQPRVKELQLRYASEPETLQVRRGDGDDDDDDDDDDGRSSGGLCWAALAAARCILHRWLLRFGCRARVCLCCPTNTRDKTQSEQQT